MTRDDMNCKDDVEEKFIRDWNEGKVKRVFDGKIMSEQIPEEAIYDPIWCIEYCKAYAEQLRDKTHANRAVHAAECIEYLLSLVQKEWVGLTYNEIKDILDCGTDRLVNIKKAEAKLKEKNGY